MNKKSVWISLAVSIAVVLFLYNLFRGTGYIRIKTPGASIQLRSGLFGLKEIMGTESVKVKAGMHRPYQATFISRDGDKWFSLRANSPWGQLQKIRVQKDQTTTIKLGPPFTVNTKVDHRGDYVYIGLSLIGQSGEYWRPIVFTNKSYLPAPGFRIVDQAGKQLYSGKFEFG
jgi:hypothetical protein